MINFKILLEVKKYLNVFITIFNFIKPALKKILLIIIVFLVFFYSFWFVFPEDKLKKFLESQLIVVFPKENFTIEDITKGWCNLNIPLIKGDNLELKNFNISLCSLKNFFNLQIPINIEIADGKLNLKYSILSKKINIIANDDINLTKIKFINNYVSFKENPSYSLMADINLASSMTLISFSAKKIKLDFANTILAAFLKESVDFSEIVFEITADEKIINIKGKFNGFFNGSILGIIAIAPNFNDSKLSLKLIGEIDKIEELEPILIDLIKNYNTKGKIQMKLTGTVRLPKIENL